MLRGHSWKAVLKEGAVGTPEFTRGHSLLWIELLLGCVLEGNSAVCSIPSNPSDLMKEKEWLFKRSRFSPSFLFHREDKPEAQPPTGKKINNITLLPCGLFLSM